MGFFENKAAIHEQSTSGGYLNPSKLSDGASVKIRILTSPVEGWEYWSNDGKPVRLKKAPATLPADIRHREGKPEKVKFFAAFCVWNYAESSVQICSLTQRTIMAALDEYSEHEDYGDPRGYDFTLSRKGKGLETEYTLIASPPKPFSFEEQAADVLHSINLNALYDGSNPFKPASASGSAVAATPYHQVLAVMKQHGFEPNQQSIEFFTHGLSCAGLPTESWAPNDAEQLICKIRDYAANTVPQRVADEASVEDTW